MKWMDESQLLEVAAEIGLQIRYWHVMDSGKDCVDLLKLLLDRYEQRLSYVIVQNQLRGDQFDILKASGSLERAQALGARVVVIKRLQEAAMTKIDGTSSSNSLRASASSGETITSVNSSPAKRAISQPRRDQDE